MQGQMTACDGAERRTAARRVMSLAAYARERDQSVFDIEVLDISTDGCRIRTDAQLEEATDIWLKIPEITPRCARIRWVKDHEVGCEFDDPIEDGVVEYLKSVARSKLRRRLFTA